MFAVVEVMTADNVAADLIALLVHDSDGDTVVAGVAGGADLGGYAVAVDGGDLFAVVDRWVMLLTGALWIVWTFVGAVGVVAGARVPESGGARGSGPLESS